jgi:uncharacterized protein
MMFANLEQHKPLLLRLRKWGFIIGIPANIAIAICEIDGKSVPHAAGLLDTFFYAIGVMPLSLAYASALTLHWMKRKGETPFKKLAPVARMALTNYLMQTVIGIILFYGIGFGFGGDIGPVIFFPIAFAIYLLQILYSNIWFKHFQYGPLEWIWRQLTYGKKLAIRKKKEPGKQTSNAIPPTKTVDV